MGIKLVNTAEEPPVASSPRLSSARWGSYQDLENPQCKDLYYEVTWLSNGTISTPDSELSIYVTHSSKAANCASVNESYTGHTRLGHPGFTRWILRWALTVAPS